MAGWHHRVFERCLLLLASALPLLPAQCPYQTAGEGSEAACRADYHVQVDKLRSLVVTDRWYTGIDAETMRATCQGLTTAYACGNALRRACAMDSPLEAETFFADFHKMAIVSLCSYPNIFEIYSRNQNCYYQLSTPLNSCGDVFDAHAGVVIARAQSGNKAALAKLCSYLNDLLSCLRTTISSGGTCSTEAINLVDTLAKPSVEMSERCSNGHVISDTQPTDAAPRSPAGSRAKAARAAGTRSVQTWLLLLSMTLAAL